MSIELPKKLIKTLKFLRKIAFSHHPRSIHYIDMKVEKFYHHSDLLATLSATFALCKSCLVCIELMDGTVKMVEIGSIQNGHKRPCRRTDLNAGLAAKATKRFVMSSF